MFAGIVEQKSRIVSAENRAGIRRVQIEMPRGWKLKLGQSIAVDGICSTVVERSAKTFHVEYMPETLSKTTADSFAKGRVVNLERSLKYGQRIDGHPMQGHVDCAVPIREVTDRGVSRELTIKPGAIFARQAMLHGSIGINGVSLTIAKKHGPNITVALIPYTLKHTNLGTLKVGNPINVEFDHSRAYMEEMRRK